MVIFIGLTAVSGKSGNTATKIDLKKAAITIEALIFQHLAGFKIFIEIRKDISTIERGIVFELLHDLI